MDWQSYLDGSMAERERTLLAARLKAEPELQSELAGYQAFIAQLEKTGQAVPVPISRLHDRLDLVLAAPPRKVSQWWLRPALITAFLLIVFFVFRGLPNRPDGTIARTPVQGVVASTNPDHASTWLTQKSGFSIPVVPTPASAQVVAASYGVGWAAIEYRLAGEKLVLYMAEKKGSTQSPVLFVNDEGTAWQANAIAYYLVGRKEVRNQVIDEMIRNTSKPVSDAPGR